MAVNIREVSMSVYSRLVGTHQLSLPLWLLPELIGCYEEKLIIVGTVGNELRAIWVVPITIQNEVKVAKRSYRFLPYASPFILENDNLKRREIVGQLFDYIISKSGSVYLPMSPEFTDLPIIQSRGALVEWRHTHRLSQSLEFERIDSRLRNHIRFANNNIKTIIADNINNFKFEVAIKGNSEELSKRKASSINIFNKGQAIIISAKDNNGLCGGVFLAFDNQTVYLMHSWQNEDSPRGTISKLIFEAINWTFKVKKMKYFDFEGSVINNIDYFFSGFNANIVPYGFIHWSASKAELDNLIERSLKIDGRVIYDKSKIN